MHGLRDGLFRITLKKKISLYHSSCVKNLNTALRIVFVKASVTQIVYYLVGQISIGVKKGPLHNVSKGPAFPPNLNK